jgi:hypothetical protein
MAMENQVNVNINVTDNGTTNKLNSAAQRLRESYEGAGAAAAGVARGTAGSRTVSGSSAPVSAQMQQYGTQRGTAGLTGSSARDFAEQSQGLSGVVRLYATAAANVYALGAAFRALSSAMDTANMVKGLDQIGAYSGKNLGTLAQRLVQATDGAISLRDALKATAQGTTAGISSANMERLSKVAKNASQALGVDMSDAMNRLSRGVSKLEPELLDELGILVKVETASANYARTLGKSAGQLTDVEKRQAFLNEVLTQGEEKFGKLALSANPFTKLAAAMQNLMQTGLELVGKVLTPIVNFLSASPMALAGVMTGIAAVIIRQAIPAVTAWRTNMRAGLEEMKEQAEISRRAFEEVQASRMSKTTQGKAYLGAKGTFDAQIKELQNFEGLSATLSRKISSNLASIGADPSKAGESIGKMINDLNRREQAINAAAKRDVGVAEKYQKEALAIKQKREELIKLAAAQKTMQANESAIDFDKGGPLSTEARQRRNMTRIDRKTKSMDVLTNTLETAESVGYRKSMSDLGGSVKKLAADPSFGKVRAGLVGIRVAALTTAAAFTTLVGSLLGPIAAVFALVEVFAVLDEMMASGAKEMGKFEESLGAVESASENAVRTLEVLQKKTGFDAANIDSVIAVANAFTDLSDAAKKAAEDAKKAKDAMGIWSGFKDTIKGIWGGDVDSKMAEGLGKSLSNAVKLLEASGRGEEFKSALKGALGGNVEVFDEKTLKAAIAGASDAVKTKLIAVWEEFDTKLKASSVNLQSFRTGLDGMDRSYQDFIVSTASNDPLFKLGASLNSFSGDIGRLLTGPIQDLNAGLAEMVKNPQKMAALGPEVAASFIEMSEGVKVSTDAIKVYDDLIGRSKERLDKLVGGGKIEWLSGPDREEAQKLQDSITNATKQRSLMAIDAMNANKEAFTNAMNVATAKGARLIDQALGNASRMAEISLQRTKNAWLVGAGAVGAEASLQRQENKIKEDAILSNIELIMSQEKLAASINAQTTATNANTLAAQAKDDPNKQAAAEAAAPGAAAALLVAEVLKTYDPMKGAQLGVTEKDAIKLQIKLDEASLGLALSMANQQLTAINTKMAAQRQSLTQTRGQTANINAGEAYKKPIEVAKEVEDRYQAELKIKQVTQQRLSALESILGLTSGILSNSMKEEINEKQKLANTAQINRMNKEIGDERLKLISKEEQAYRGLVNSQKANTQEAEDAFKAILSQVDKLEKAGATVTKDKTGKVIRTGQGLTKDEASSLRQRLNERRGVEVRQIEEAETRAQESRIQGLNLELERISKRGELEKVQLSVRQEQQTAALDFYATEQTAYSSLYGQSESLNNLMQYRLSIQKAELQVAQTISQINVDSAQKVEALQAKRRFAEADPTLSAAARASAVAELDAQIERERQLAVTAGDSARIKYEYAVKNAEITKKVSDEQARYNKLLTDADELSSSLAKVFEGIGNGIDGMATSWARFGVGLGEAVKSMVQFSVESAKSQKNIADIDAKIAASRLQNGDAEEDSDQTKQLLLERTKAVKKSQQQEIAGYAQLAGAAKNMFKQKTGAYKAFAAFEKTMQVFSMALKIKEMLFDDVATTKKVANDQIKMASDEAAASKSGIRAIIDVMTGLPLPLAIAAGAAMAAIVASLLSDAPTVSMPSAPTAEQKNESYGTAQAYGSDNQLQQYRTGVLGDATARSTTVTDSLELIGANSVESLAYSYRMVTNLIAIKAGINNLAGAFKTARGLSVGSAFGTKEATTQGGNFISKTTRETDIQSSGIKLAGSLFDLRDNVINSARVFEEGVVKTSKRYFGVYNKNSERAFYKESGLTEAVGETAAKRIASGIEKTIGRGVDLAFTIGGRMGLTEADVTNYINRNLIDPTKAGVLNLRDVPLDEQAAVIEAWTTGMLDSVFGPMLSGFAQYANETAEDLTGIAIRVITQFDNANAQLKAMPGFDGIDTLLQAQGLSTRDVLMRGVEITQGLADSFGGYEAFMEGIQEFNNSILTEEEQQANKRAMVQQAMKNAGLEHIQNMDQFRATYQQALRDSTSSNAGIREGAIQMLHDLIAIGPAFKEIGTEGSAMIEKLKDAFKLTKDSVKGILLDVLKNAKDAADAQTKAQEAAAKLVYESIIENAVDAVSTQLFDAAIQPLMTNVVNASANAAAQTVAGGVVAGTAMQQGGVMAGQALSEAVDKARAYVSTMSAIFKDPQFKVLMGDMIGTVGTFAADLYTNFQGLPGVGAAATPGATTAFDLTKFLEDLQKEIDSTNKQLRQLTMSSYDKALEDINEKVANYTKQLKEAAVGSEAATLAIQSFKEAQIALLDAQNKAKATELMGNLRQQMSDALLSPIGKELVANSRQAADYAKQLRDINQLTDENIQLVNELENANRRRIIDAAIQQQNTTYDQLFKTNLGVANSAQKLVNKFKALGYEMPKSIEELQNLVDGINYTSEAGLNLRGNVIELAQEFSTAFSTLSDAVRSAYDKRVEELTSARDEFKDFATSIRDFKQSLLIGADSPLSPLEKYNRSKDEFVRISQLAQGGDKVAMGQLQGVSQTFLEQSKGMFAGTESYLRDFNAVVGVLDSTESVAEIQMHTAIDTLQGVRDMVSGIISVEEAVNNTNTAITGWGASLTEALANYSMYTGLDISSLPKLAQGTNYVPNNMVAMVHQGERVIPAADNAKLMLKLEQEIALVSEVKELNRQMKELTNVVAQGSTINSDSTDQNTKEIVNAMNDLQKALIYVQKVQGKAMIV